MEEAFVTDPPGNRGGFATRRRCSHLRQARRAGREGRRRPRRRPSARGRGSKSPDRCRTGGRPGAGGGGWTRRGRRRGTSPSDRSPRKTWAGPAKGGRRAVREGDVRPGSSRRGRGARRRSAVEDHRNAGSGGRRRGTRRGNVPRARVFAASRPDANASPPDAVVSSRTPSKVPAVVMSDADRRGASETRLLFRFVARRRGLDRARAFGDGAATFDGSRGDVRRLARVQSDVPTRVVRDDSRRAK